MSNYPTAADLDRRTNTGRIYGRHRVTVEPGAIVDDRAVEAMWRDSCAPEGGKHADPVPTERHRPGLGVVLVLIGWPLVAVAAAVVAIIAQHMG